MTADDDRVPARVRFVLAAVALAVGAAVSWRYRHSMYPDGVQYVDVARRFDAVGVHGLLNGTWSPLFPVQMAAFWRVAHPSRYWLYPSVHAVGFANFLVAVAAFDYFVGRVLMCRRRLAVAADGVDLSPTAVAIAAYAVFMLVVGYLLNIRLATPDMIVAAVIFAASGLLLTPDANGWTLGGAALLGALLAVGYLDKTAMFPVGVLYALSSIALADGRHARAMAAVAASTFVVVALVWMVPLSIWKGRPTFGETGTLMYAWWVNGWNVHLHWLGDPPGSGIPRHPIRQLAAHPDAFAFIPQEPVTYTLFFDPSYWHDGITPRVNLPDQLRALRRTGGEFVSMLREGFLLLGPVIAAAMGGSKRATWRRLRAFRLAIVPASLAILLHFGVHVEGRLIAGPLTVLIVTVVASFTFAHARTGRLVAAACVAAAIGTSGPYFAGAFYGTLKDMRGGERRIVDPAWTIAEALRTRRFRPGDRVAVIGNDYDVTWAQRAELTIVGELSSDQLGAYVGADAPVRQHVVDAFRALGVRGVIARSTSCVFDAAPWARIPATDFSVLEQAGR